MIPGPTCALHPTTTAQTGRGCRSRTGHVTLSAPHWLSSLSIVHVKTETRQVALLSHALSSLVRQCHVTCARRADWGTRSRGTIPGRWLAGGRVRAGRLRVLSAWAGALTPAAKGRLTEISPCLIRRSSCTQIKHCDNNYI